MIHVPRDQTDINGKEIRPNEAWFQTADEATQNAVADGSTHTAIGEIYGAPQVRMALERLFRSKCAYCETTILEGSFDVDHFRPKKRVKERADHPGYYWLTYKWENLYPSCQNCNRRLWGKPQWSDPTRGSAGGKQNQFPLSNESSRALGPTDDVNRELRLLLDPCHDLPEEVLGYYPNGQAFALGDDSRANSTIRAFNFRNRQRLRERRGQVMADVQHLLEQISIAEQDENTNVRIVKGLRELLNQRLEPSAEYAGAARFSAASAKN